jgi:hypothetical protein
MPMTPQALPPLPRSSVPAWITMVRPTMLGPHPTNQQDTRADRIVRVDGDTHDWGPMRDKCLAVKLTLITPLASVWTLPRSPTCFSSESGLPCFLLKGLK